MLKKLVAGLLAATLMPAAALAQDDGFRQRGAASQAGRGGQADAQRFDRPARVVRSPEQRQARQEQRAERQAQRAQRVEQPRVRVETGAALEGRRGEGRADARAGGWNRDRQRDAIARQRLGAQLRDDPVAARRADRNGVAGLDRRDRGYDPARGDRPRRDDRVGREDRRADRVDWNRPRDEQALRDRWQRDRARRDDRSGWGNRGYDNGARFGNRWNGNGRDRWSRDWRQDNRYDWSRYRTGNRNAYRLPRYYAPYGWNGGYRRFSIGVSLSSVLWGQNYWIDDPWDYRLPPAYGPYRWVRYYNDALLVDIETGEVVDTVYGIFWG